MEQIEELREYNLKLETTPDEPKKKRKLNETGVDLMGEAMSEELANKNILISNLTRENEKLKEEV